MRINSNSLRFKISFLAILILAAALIVYSALLYFNFRYLLYQELDDGLRAKAQKINNAIVSYMKVLGDDQQSFEFSVRRVISQTGNHTHENKIEKLEQLWLGQAEPLGLRSDYIIFFDDQGLPVARSRNLWNNSYNLILPKDIRALHGRSLFSNLRLGKKHLRVVLLPVSYQNRLGNKQFVLLVAGSSEHALLALKKRRFFMIVSLCLILGIATLLSERFVKRVLRPVQEITHAAKEIDYKDLSLRLNTEGVDEEIKDLADSLNQMLFRLERSFKYIAEFSSHVSHELKTPLAILRGESELALRSKHSSEEYRSMIKSNLEEINRMTKIINDLLLLTKLDYQPEVFHFEDFDLVEFFGEIGESAKILADPKEIAVELEVSKNKSIPLHGDKVHLRRLFFNLINNAIKFTPPGGVIRLCVATDVNHALVSVSDTGVGIAEDKLPHIFEKFFHSDDAGLDGTTGNGLGLSIAQSISRIHHGDIQVQSVPNKGSIFTVQLPL